MRRDRAGFVYRPAAASEMRPVRFRVKRIPDGGWPEFISIWRANGHAVEKSPGGVSMVVCKAVGNSYGGGHHRLPRTVGVAGGRLDLAVAEELGDHRQAFAEGERHGREAGVKNRPAACGSAWTAAQVAVLALAGCAGEAYTASPGDPDKPARACLAV